MELTKEVVQDIIQTEMKNAREGMISQADFEAKMTALKADAKAQSEAIDAAVKKVDAEIKEILQKQGEDIRKMQESGGRKSQVKTIYDLVVENKDFFQTQSKSSNVPNTAFPIELKALTAASLTGASGNRTDMDIDAIVKNSPFVMALLRNRITMPANNEGFYVYYEQTLNTNNASKVAENGTPSDNVYTWEKKSIASYEVKAKTTISIRQMYDLQFLADTVRNLLSEDWVLKVEDYLINSTANIFGLLYYATEFDFANATKSANPNLMDVLRKVKAQITKQGKNKFKPNLAFMAVDAVEEMAGAKNDFGDYIMPNWAMGGDINFSGVQILENELANDNQVVMGDMSKAKLIIWDDMVLRTFQEGTQASEGLITLQVEGRMNLLVKTNDKPAIVKVTNLSDAITGIKAPSA